ncbi:MAG TPA: hypothetical protein VFL85_03655 [Candidatus Saccharimonadales bacterium]|nr:hypothetical protein [Candidatus Saccharimonadales bacterium]
MSISGDGYRVVFEPYASRHYIKDFEKKYKGAWLSTRKALVSEFRNIDMLINSGKTKPPIHMTTDKSQWIVKHEFVIAGRGESKKTSGRRVIVYVNDTEKVARVLLVYHKDHVDKKAGETAWWERTIKSEYKLLMKDFSF